MLNSETNGVFKVGETGQLVIDYLFDGGLYEGEFGIFSLDNLNTEDLTSVSFKEQAINRAQSNSLLGHIIIKDHQEGAKFTSELEWEKDFNVGTYAGRKIFSMNPEDNFGIVLVPNGTLNEVLTSEKSIESQNILFSIPAANNGEQIQFADVTSSDRKTIIGFEDIPTNSDSNNDYNDVIFGIEGIKQNNLLSIVDLISDNQNWLKTSLGETISNYVKTRNGSSNSNDILIGDSGNNNLNGEEGDDFFDGGHGDDTLNGGKGNDTIWGWTGNDLIYGGNGDDVLVSHDGDDILHGEEGNDFFNAGNDNDTVTGGKGNDTIWGWTGNDLIHGNDGDDLLVSHDGDDILHGGEDNDFLDSGNGNDTVTGGKGNDTIWGWTGNDLIHGSDGDDQLLGYQDNDTLNGGGGNDYLHGGEGNDIFVLEAKQGRDFIADYLDGSDKLGLGTSLSFEDLNIIQSGSNVVIHDLANNEIALIANSAVNDITAEDFI